MQVALGVVLLLITLVGAGCKPPVDVQGDPGDGPADEPGPIDSGIGEAPPWDGPAWEGLDVGPYVTVISATEASIQWRTLEPADSNVWLAGPTGSETVLGDGELRVQHAVRVPNLAAGSNYPYRIWSRNDQGVAVSQEYALRWLPRLDEPLRIVMQSDTHARQEMLGWGAIIAEFQPHLIVDAGDHVFKTNEVDEWRSEAKVMPYLAEVPYLTAWGNHDYDDWTSECWPFPHCPNIGPDNPAFQFWDLPGNGRWYSVSLPAPTAGLANSVSFLMLDSNWRYDTKIAFDEPVWLGDTVDQLLAAEQPPDYILSAFHHPPSANQPLGIEPYDAAWLDSNFVPHLERAAAELVLVGHHHGYVRNAAGDSIYVQVVSGTDPINTPRPGADVVVTDVRSLLLVEIDENSIHGRAVTQTGQVLDEFERPRNPR